MSDESQNNEFTAAEEHRGRLEAELRQLQPVLAKHPDMAEAAIYIAAAHASLMKALVRLPASKHLRTAEAAARCAMEVICTAAAVWKNHPPEPLTVVITSAAQLVENQRPGAQPPSSN